MITKFRIAFLLLLFMLLCGCFFFLPRSADPARCALCTAGRYHAPCLLNLSTGELFELAVYSPHEQLEAELSPSQPSVLAIQMSGGIFAYSDPRAGWCDATEPHIKEPPRASLFCGACGALLRPYYKDGYVLLDLYAGPECYPFRADASYDIRDYHVNIVNKPDSTPNTYVRVTSDLFSEIG